MSGRKWVLVASVFVVGMLLGTLLSQFYISNPTEYRVGVWLRVYIDNVLVLEKRSDSPTENFGNLSAAWFKPEFYTDINSWAPYWYATKFDGATQRIYLTDMYGGSTTAGSRERFFFFALDDSTPPPYSPQITKPYDVDSVIDYIFWADSGTYVDQNGQIVVYVTSENYAPAQNRTYSVLGFGLMIDKANGFVDSNLVLLFYDPLGTPLDIQAGQTIRIEYRFVYP